MENKTHREVPARMPVMDKMKVRLMSYFFTFQICVNIASAKTFRNDPQSEETGVICVMLWLGLWSSSFVAGPVQHRMAAAPHERRFVHLSAHRCPGALHQWRLPHGSRDRCTLQEEVSWSRGASGSEWVWIIITDKCNTHITCIWFSVFFAVFCFV